MEIDPNAPERGGNELPIESGKSLEEIESQDFVELLKGTGSTLSSKELQDLFNEVVKNLSADIAKAKSQYSSIQGEYKKALAQSEPFSRAGFKNLKMTYLERLNDVIGTLREKMEKTVSQFLPSTQIKEHETSDDLVHQVLGTIKDTTIKDAYKARFIKDPKTPFLSTPKKEASFESMIKETYSQMDRLGEVSPSTTPHTPISIQDLENQLTQFGASGDQNVKALASAVLSEVKSLEGKGLSLTSIESWAYAAIVGQFTKNSEYSIGFQNIGSSNQTLFKTLSGIDQFQGNLSSHSFSTADVSAIAKSLSDGTIPLKNPNDTSFINAFYGNLQAGQNPKTAAQNAYTTVPPSSVSQALQIFVTGIVNPNPPPFTPHTPTSIQDLGNQLNQFAASGNTNVKALALAVLDEVKSLEGKGLSLTSIESWAYAAIVGQFTKNSEYSIGFQNIGSSNQTLFKTLSGIDQFQGNLSSHSFSTADVSAIAKSLSDGTISLKTPDALAFMQAFYSNLNSGQDPQTAATNAYVKVPASKLSSEMNAFIQALSLCSPTPPHSNITNGVWYASWTQKVGPGGIPVIPGNVNEVDISTGHLEKGPDGKWKIAGIEGALSDPDILKKFVEKCHEKGIKVDIMIGGTDQSGSGINWPLNSGNTAQVGQDVAQQLKDLGVDGIDLDYEPANEAAEGYTYVGEFAKALKANDSNLNIALTSNADPSWQKKAELVFQAAGRGVINKVNLMAYYDPKGSYDIEGAVKQWLPFMQEHGLDPADLTVGLSANLNEKDMVDFAKWAKTEGMSTTIWPWSGDDTTSGKLAKDIWDVYHPTPPQPVYPPPPTNPPADAPPGSIPVSLTIPPGKNLSDIYVRVNGPNGALILRPDGTASGTQPYGKDMSIYGFPLSKFNATAKTGRTITIYIPPNIPSGRIYFSVGKPLVWAQPDINNGSDPDCSTQFTMMEFTSSSTSICLDESAVDGFSGPSISTQPYLHGNPDGVPFGATEDPNTFMNNVKDYINTHVTNPDALKAWMSMFNSIGGIDRMSSPKFHTDVFGPYFQDYLSKVFIPYIQSNPLYFDINNDKFLIKLSPDGQNLEYCNWDGSSKASLPLSKISWKSWLSGSPDGVTSDPCVMQGLSALLMSGMDLKSLGPTGPNDTQCLSNTTFVKYEKEGKFFQTTYEGKPMYNVYEQAMHAEGWNAYAYDYDDLFGQDKTITLPVGPTEHAGFSIALNW